MDQRPYYDYSAAHDMEPRQLSVFVPVSVDMLRADAYGNPHGKGAFNVAFPAPFNDASYQVMATLTPLERALPRADERNAHLKLAELRALDLLQKHIGASAVAAIQAGGGYPVKSKLWPGVVYLVPLGTHTRIKVMDNGVVVAESCLVGDDSTLPWPDLMLQRIRAIELDETIVHTTGVVHTPKRRRIPRWANTLMGREE